MSTASIAFTSATPIVSAWVGARSPLSKVRHDDAADRIVPAFDLALALMSDKGHGRHGRVPLSDPVGFCLPMSAMLASHGASEARHRRAPASAFDPADETASRHSDRRLAAVAADVRLVVVCR
jgi:hypothetical protein